MNYGKTININVPSQLAKRLYMLQHNHEVDA